MNIPQNGESFEEALKKLEIIVKNLEKGDVPLADMIASYEEGVRLKNICQARLDEAKLKIEAIVLNDGKPTGTKDFQAG